MVRRHLGHEAVIGGGRGLTGPQSEVLISVRIGGHLVLRAATCERGLVWIEFFVEARAWVAPQQPVPPEVRSAAPPHRCDLGWVTPSLRTEGFVLKL